MPPDAHDLARLEDMRTAAALLVRNAAQRTRASLDTDQVFQAAVERWIETIGEAARAVSPGCQKEHPEIAWRKIIATRHILAHDYGNVDPEVLWKIATIHAPELLKALSEILHSQAE